MSSLMFEARLALRYLAGARGQGTFSLLTILAILGNMMGVAALVVGQAVMAGIQSQARDILVERDPHIWITPEVSAPPAPSARSGTDLGLSDADRALLGLPPVVSTEAPPATQISFDEALFRRLEAVEELTGIHPVSETDVFLNLGGRFTLSSLQGLSLAALQEQGVTTRSLPETEEWGLIVPSGLIYQGFIEVGQTLTLITTELQASPVGRLPLTQDFQVVDTYIAPANAPLLTPLATAQLMRGEEGQVSHIEVFVRDPFNLNQQRRDLEAALADIPGPSLFIETWQQRRDSAVAFIGVLRLVLLLILGLIILVSAFNIFTGQLMLTDAQRTSIAVMRTYGASQGHVLRIFLIAGLIVGLSGVMLGLVLGLVVAQNFPLLSALGVPGLSFFDQSPPQVRAGDLALAYGIALTLTLIAAIFPARAAARTSPVEAFSYG